MSDNIERKVFKGINTKISDKFVEAGLEKLRACINCGTCTGGCPSGRRTAYRTRAALRKALLGDESVLTDPDIWMCSTCYYCYERCPRDIPVTDMIIKLRNIAVEECHIMDSHFGLADKIFWKTGHGVPANAPDQQKWRDLRESYGLPPLPPTVHSHPDAVEECQTLMREVGFRELLDRVKKAKEEEKAKQEAKKEEEEA